MINLKKRTDRMESATRQLNAYNIPFERWEAIEHQKGAEGLKLTMIQIFTHCLRNKYKQVLILEDDVDFVQEELHEVMDNIVKDFPPQFDLIFLGGQLCNQPSEFYGINLMKVRNVYATHAVIYSNKAMKKIMSEKITAPIDNWYAATILNENNSYMAYPLLCSQIIGHSDIYSDQDTINWKPYIEKKYAEQIHNLRISGKLPSNIKTYN